VKRARRVPFWTPGAGAQSACLTLLGLFLLVSSWFGCGEKTLGLTRVEVLTEQGWDFLEAGDYAEALVRFDAALAEDSTFAEAHNGRGWALTLPAAGFDYAEALRSFDAALAFSLGTADPFAGKSFIYRSFDPADRPAAGDPALAITAADSALARDPRWSLEHHPAADHRDLFWIQAASYFDLSQYLDSKAAIDSLGGVVLDPEDQYFTQDLLAEIERWSAILGVE